MLNNGGIFNMPFFSCSSSKQIVSMPGAEEKMDKLLNARKSLNAIKDAKETDEEIQQGLSYLVDNITLANAAEMKKELIVRFPKLFDQVKILWIVKNYIFAFINFERDHPTGNKHISNCKL